MRRLIVSNTYYQLLFAMQLRKTVFSDDYVAILLSDHSIGAELLVKRLSEVDFFSEIHFFRTPLKVDKRNALQRMQDYVDISFRNDNRYSRYLDDLCQDYYDELLVFNYSIETYGFYAELCKHNPQMRVSLYEEGVLSYNLIKIDNYKRRIINATRFLLNKPVISEALNNFYCFYPHLYKGNLKAIKVPQITKDDNFVLLLKKIFCVPDFLDYKEKYIYLSGVYDFEGDQPIGEFELVKKIVQQVGKDNLIVKIHPRDNRNIYLEEGIKVDKCSNIPWEVMLLCGDYRNNIFLSATSTSLISSNLLFEEHFTGIFLFKLCDCSHNKMANEIIKVIEKLLSDKILEKDLSSVMVVDTLEQVFENV